MTDFLIVSDRLGVVGAFADADQARAALADFDGEPFVATRWPRAAPPPGAEDRVWFLAYVGAPAAVAFASDSRAEVERVQKQLTPLDLVFADDVDCSTLAVGEVSEISRQRLAARCEHLAEVERRLFAPLEEEAAPAPPARLDILASIVPRPLEDA